MLTGPSVGALICDVLCGAQYEPSVTQAGPSSCHEEDSPSDTNSPIVSASHVCHEMGSVPASIVRHAAPHLAIAQAVVRGISDILTDAATGRDIAARQERLTSHAPPLAALPLRI
jgi:hypothetical protein